MLQFRLTGTQMGLLVPGEVKNGLSGTKRGFLVPERILNGRAPTGLAIAARCLFLDVVTAKHKAQVRKRATARTVSTAGTLTRASVSITTPARCYSPVLPFIVVDTLGFPLVLRLVVACREAYGHNA
jgi:hypothetical protein